MLLEAAGRRGEELSSGKKAAPARAEWRCVRETNQAIAFCFVLIIFKSWHARDRQGCVHDVLSFGSSLMLLFFYIICKQDLWCLDGVGFSLFTSYSGVVPNLWDMMVDEKHCFSPVSGWLRLCLGAQQKASHRWPDTYVIKKLFWTHPQNFSSNILKKSNKNNFLQKEFKWGKKWKLKVIDKEKQQCISILWPSHGAV